MSKFVGYSNAPYDEGTERFSAFYLLPRYIGYSNAPYDEGTESDPMLQEAVHDGSYSNAPYDEGTERLSANKLRHPGFKVTVMLPMMRELKGLNRGHDG